MRTTLPDVVTLPGAGPGAGRFVREPDRPDCYVARQPFAGQEVTVILHDEDLTRPRLDAAARQWCKVRDLDDLVLDDARHIAAERLFAKWLFEWDGSEDVTLAAWKEGLAADRIWVMADGALMVDFAMNRPFAGHRVTASGKAPGTFTDAYLSI